MNVGAGRVKMRTASALGIAIYLLWIHASIVALLTCLNVLGCKLPKVSPARELIGVVLVEFLQAHMGQISRKLRIGLLWIRQNTEEDLAVPWERHREALCIVPECQD